MKVDIPKDWCLNMAKLEDGQEISAGSQREIDALELDIAGSRALGTLETSIHDPVTGEKNSPGTRADIFIEDVEWVMKTIAALQDDRVRMRAEIRAMKTQC